MSGPAYLNTPEDQDALTQIQRRQQYARALMQQGADDPGHAAYGGLRNAGNSILGAFLANRADKSETGLAKTAGDKYTRDMAALLSGNQPSQAPAAPMPPPMASTQPSPQISNSAGSGPIMPNAGATSPQGAIGGQQPSPTPMAPPQPVQAPQDPLQRLVATGNPALMAQFGPGLFNHQIERSDQAADYQRDRADKAMRVASVQEKQAAGIDPRTPVMVDAFGKMQPISDPNQITAYQQAEIANQKATLGETARHNRAGELADDRVDPDTVKYWSQSVAAGAPLPALGMGKQAALYRQAILKGAAQINSGKGLTGTDQNVNTATTKANSGALGKQTALRTATEGFENTMLQNMNVVRSLLKKGAGTTGIPVINRYQQYVRGQYQGDPDVIALSNAIDTVADENAKIRSGTLGNTPATDAMRAAIHKGLNDSQTPEQILSAFDVMQRDAGNRSRALRAQEDAIKRGLTGKSDLPQIPGISEPQAQVYSQPMPATLPSGWSVRVK